MKFKIICFFFLVSGFFLSCHKEEKTISMNSNSDYFPSNVGHEIIYDIDSISKSDFTNQIDTFHFQIKEVIESIITDNEGRPTLRFERYKRSDESKPWVIFKVWSANLTNTTAEKKEDNITYIKLVFPVMLNKRWNGNVMNDLDDKEYRYISANLPESFNSFIFDSALTVLQNNFDDRIISKDYEVEKYATRTGMFFKESFTGFYNSPITLDMLTLEDSLNKFLHYTEKIISVKN
jgi:hypothetical protein